MQESTENQKLILLGMVSVSAIMLVHSYHVHKEEAMKRKYYGKIRETLAKMQETDLYKRATPSEKFAILEEFKLAGNLFK